MASAASPDSLELCARIRLPSIGLELRNQVGEALQLNGIGSIIEWGLWGLLDFDNSGSVDFPDFLFFVGKFGAQLGEDNFDSRCDLDANGVIDFSDFLAFAQAFSL